MQNYHTFLTTSLTGTPKEEAVAIFAFEVSTEWKPGDYQSNTVEFNK